MVRLADFTKAQSTPIGFKYERMLVPRLTLHHDAHGGAAMIRAPAPVFVFESIIYNENLSNPELIKRAIQIIQP